MAHHDPVNEGFPHPIVEQIIGTLMYETIAALNLQVSANAASVQSNLGDGRLGHLTITISPAVYNTHSNTLFVVPVNPGTTPVISANANAQETNIIVRRHAANVRIFLEYRAKDNAIKQQIIGSVDGMYLRTLRSRITGFANVSTWQMLDHLNTTYSRLTPADLQNNDARMKADYDPNQPIQVLIDQIEDGVALASAVPQIISVAYTLVFPTRMFTKACREWHRKPVTAQNWTNFKVDLHLPTKNSVNNSLLGRPDTNQPMQRTIFNKKPTWRSQT
jgi:hypothetical protein